MRAYHARADPAWYEDIRVLSLRPLEFFPSRDQSAEERLNAVVRLTAYASLAAFVFSSDSKHLVAGAIATLLASVCFHAGEDRSAGFRSAGFEGFGGERGVPRRSGQRRRPTCTRSTRDNPFANMLLSDEPGRPAACKYSQHGDLVERNFNHGLVRNLYDVYDRENGRRQFVTMPVTQSAPDTTAFARFCYGGTGRSTCKEDTSQCTGYN